mgnify:FL=1
MKKYGNANIFVLDKIFLLLLIVVSVVGEFIC